MKDFIDRGHFVIEQLLHDKYCITVATGENYGSRDALKVMDNLVLFSGGKLCCHLRVRTPLNDELQSVKRISGRMINAMQRKKMFPVQKLIHAFIFNFGIRPFVKRKGTAYSGVAEKWERLGIL